MKYINLSKDMILGEPDIRLCGCKAGVSRVFDVRDSWGKLSELHMYLYDLHVITESILEHATVDKE